MKICDVCGRGTEDFENPVRATRIDSISFADHIETGEAMTVPIEIDLHDITCAGKVLRAIAKAIEDSTGIEDPIKI